MEPVHFWRLRLQVFFWSDSSSGSWIFLKRLRLQGVKNNRLLAAPAPAPWGKGIYFSFQRPHTISVIFRNEDLRSISLRGTINVKHLLLLLQELHNMECELAAQREQMAAKQREHLQEKERLKQLKVGGRDAAVLLID